MNECLFLQYFYNPEICQFLYWDYESHSYVPVPADVNSDTQTENVSTEQSTTSAASADSSVDKKPETAAVATVKDDKSKQEKALHAKKVAKVCKCWCRNSISITIFFHYLTVLILH